MVMDHDRGAFDATGTRVDSAFVLAGGFRGLDVGCRAGGFESSRGTPEWSAVGRATFERRALTYDCQRTSALQELAMGLINWVFDLYQQSRIEDLHRQARDARAEAFALRGATPVGNPSGAALERALGELALAVKAVQRLAVQKGLCTQAEFAATMEQIDREDGCVDGMSRWK
jgi:hypothetical protein